MPTFRLLKSSTLFCILWFTCFSNTAAQNKWQLPRSGWLYVLDADLGADEAHLLLIDPVKGVVEGTITVGRAPEFAVNSDRSKIFIVSGAVDGGEITVYDVRSGRSVASTVIMHRILSTSWPQAGGIAVSRDGRWLYAETMQTMAPGIDDYGVLRFEVSKTSITASGQASLPACGVADLIPVSGANWDLLVHCPLSNVTRLILFDTDGSVLRYRDLSLPSRPFDPDSGQMEHSPMATRAVAYRAGSDMMVLTGANELCRLNSLDETGPCASFPEVHGSWIPTQSWSYSADGRFLYFGSGPVSERSDGTARVIQVVDAGTMKLVSSISVGRPFRTLAIDANAKKLYAASPEAHAIMEIDIATLKEEKAIVISDSHPTVVVPVP